MTNKGKKKEDRRAWRPPKEKKPLAWEQPGEGTAFAKVGNYGLPASGKTVTTALLAIGLALSLKIKDVWMYDSEGGSDFVAPLYKRHGVRFWVRRSRAFATLAETIRELADSGNILIVDSITHPWKELIGSYLETKQKTFVTMPDWGVLKPVWEQQWSAPFLVSSLHVFTSGRLQFEWETFQNPEGELEAHKVGTKMRAETEFGYEPSLVFEMERLKRQASEQGLRELETKAAREAQAAELLGSREFVHRATVVKDRSMVLMGRKFLFEPPAGDEPPNPMAVWERFEPFFQQLAVGKSHQPLAAGQSSAHLFQPGARENFRDRQQQRTILLEQLQEEIRRFLPWQSERAKALKADVLQELFNTRSWTAVETQVPVEAIEEALRPGPRGGKPRVELLAMNKRDAYMEEQQG